MKAHIRKISTIPINNISNINKCKTRQLRIIKIFIYFKIAI